MQPAPLPDNETQRLALLRRLQVLDTQSEEAYDDIVAMARDLSGAPTALVSLVDETRQWFKARLGLEACETGRAESFCAHVVHSGSELLVEDAHADPRFSDNPLVTGAPRIRFYAGFPLTMSGGEVMGTLCVIDSRPRRLEPAQVQSLRRLARQVVALLKKRMLVRDLEASARELGQREWVFERALQAAGEAMWDWNAAAGALNAAASHASLLGYDVADFPQDAEVWQRLMHPDDVEPTRTLLRAHMAGESEVYEADYRMRHRLGHWVWVRSRGEVVERDAAGRATRMLGTVLDITQRKELEHRVQHLNARLKDEAEQARALADAKARFLATMAHEIRTPLNSILGASRLALEDTDTATMRDNIALVHEASRNLARLVDSILDFSRLEAQRVELELSGLSIHGLMTRLQEMFRLQSQAKGVALRCLISPEVPSIVRADALRMEQVLVNLLGNAFKFTAQGSITVSVESSGDSAQRWLAFVVRDTGIGIAPERLRTLFTPFVQADESISRQFGGTGLGLAISRQLARLMGGDVEIHSVPGEGTEAWFRVPMVVGAASEVATPSSTGTSLQGLSAQDMQGLRALVVDDNLMNLTVIERMLRRVGMQVQVADGGERAIAALDREAFDVVLMDLYMPGINGAETTRMIRATPAIAEVPVLAVSASVTPQERNYCTQSGMDGFVSKPVKLEDLLSEIRRVVKRKCNV